MQHTSSEELRDRMRDYLRRSETPRHGKSARDSGEGRTTHSAKDTDQPMDCWCVESEPSLS